MKKEPDFYLVSTEYIPPIGPLECYIENVLNIDGISYLKIILNPGLYGGNEEINKVILGPRYEGDTLIYSKKWPIYVNIFLVNKNNLDNFDIKTLNDLKIIAWAEAHKTKRDSVKALE